MVEIKKSNASPLIVCMNTNRMQHRAVRWRVGCNVRAMINVVYYNVADGGRSLTSGLGASLPLVEAVQ